MDNYVYYEYQGKGNHSVALRSHYQDQNWVSNPEPPLQTVEPPNSLNTDNIIQIEIWENE